MKKSFIVGIALSFSAFPVFAKPVDLETARKAAANFMDMKSGHRADLEAFNYFSGKEAVQPPFYVFTNDQSPGFVIISGDDAVRPVLGYSLHHAFQNAARGVSPEVKYWLGTYADQIKAVQNRDLEASNSVTDLWSDLLTGDDAGNGNVAQKVTTVSPMLNTDWDQLPYYNEDCPATPYSLYNPTYHAPTGCVATAMAQIMKYWNAPATGTGTHSYSSSTVGGTMSADFGNTAYDWTNMPNVLDNNSSTTQIDAVATLMYHCGIAVNMDYDTLESGAWVINYGNSGGFACSQNALPAYFGYKSTIEGYQRSQFTDSTWLKMLKFELDNGRPVLYTGAGSVGAHAFDFDGYDDNDYFHINWGWGGLSNGYFVVDSLHPSALGTGAGSGNFNYGQEALIMIEPDSSALPANPYTPDFIPDSVNFTLVVDSGSLNASADTIHYGDPYQFSAILKNEGPGNLDHNNYNILVLAQPIGSTNAMPLDYFATDIPAGQTYNYQFSSPSMTALTPGRYMLFFVYADGQGNGYMVEGETSQSGNAQVLTILPQGEGVNELNQEHGVAVYPNPADHSVFVQVKHADIAVKSIQLYDQGGRLVYEAKAESAGQTDFPVSQLANGLYVLKLQTNKGRLQQKIVIRH
ncbi:MAG TPA: thiol protease/hemagglutinin PrtT [Edaphocola sp.]|nr:thiol protease/hemagglutinin PrtT [Edaphocola sp.]